MATQTPAVPTTECRVVIKLEYYQPVRDKSVIVPPGVVVKLMDVTGSTPSVIEEQTTDDKSTVRFAKRRYGSMKVAVFVEPPHDYVDLEADQWVTSAVALDDRRRLLRLPKQWDSREQEKFSDDREGRFKTGVFEGIYQDEGRENGPWVLQIDHAWKKFWVLFQYYDPRATQEDGICPGIRVEAYDDPGLAEANVVAACTPIDDTGKVYLPVFKKTAPNKLYVGFHSAPNSYLSLAETDRKKRLMTLTPDQHQALPGIGKRGYYPVPELWSSEQQRARLAGTASDLQTHAGTPASSFMMSRTEPIKFHLDDFVLVDEARKPLAWPPTGDGATQRITLFDHVLRIRNQDPEHHYWSEDAVERNLFKAESCYFVAGKNSDYCTRVVALNRQFYDLVEKRTTVGPIRGARAAVRNDHPYDKMSAGNYECHFFHECTTYSYSGGAGAPLSHLLLYWSVFFQWDPTTTASDQPKDAAKKATQQAAVDSYRHTGLMNAKGRHQGHHPSHGSPGMGSKDYVLAPYPPDCKSTPPDHWIKLFYHFEGRDGTPAHCTATIITGDDKTRSSMGWNTATFAVGDELPEPPVATDHADHNDYSRLTIAHEIGHALGLRDEYMEPMHLSVWESTLNDFTPPILPRTDTEPYTEAAGQRYEGMPYSRDAVSLMQSNRAQRLRHIWHHCRWINENTKVQGLLKNIQFQAQYEIVSGPREPEDEPHPPDTSPTRLLLEYYLRRAPKDNRDFYHNAQNFYASGKAELVTHGPTGRMDLLLFKLGQDELGRYGVHNLATDFDSILVVRLRLLWIFKPLSPPEPYWKTWREKRNVMRKLEHEACVMNGTQDGGWTDRAEGHAFILESQSPPIPDPDPTRPRFQRCLVYIRPFYAYNPGSLQENHFQINVWKHSSSGAPTQPDIANPAYTQTTVQIFDDTDKIALFRYLLGLNHCDSDGDLNTDPIEATELRFLAKWMANRCRETYIIRQV